MNRVPYILFISILIIDYLSINLKVIPFYFSYLSEFIAGLLFIAIVFRAAYTKKFDMSPKYLILFSIFLAHIIGGIILNNVHGGAVFLGIRVYFKFVPFFLIHAIYEYSDRQIATQMKVLLALAFIQLPVAFYQRFIQYKGHFSGDEVRGTISTSSALSILLISVITIILAFYLKRRFSARQFIVLALLLFLPTTVNETKGTLFLLPFAVISVLIFSAKDRASRKRMINVIAIMGLLAFMFVGVYSMFYIKDDSRGGVGRFFTDPKELVRYLYRGDEFNQDLLKPKKGGGTIATAHVKEHKFYSRLDTMIAPIVLLSSDATKLIFGLGIGNVTPTKKTAIMGDYMHLSLVIGANETVITLMLWEVGLLGLFIFVLFLYLIFKDVRRHSNENTFTGTLALGWIGVVILFILSLPYKNIIVFNALAYLFWYLSGYLTTKHYRTAQDKIRPISKSNNFSRLSRKNMMHNSVTTE